MRPLHPKTNFQLQRSNLTQQVGAFSQANTPAQNSYVYPTNVQMVNIQSNAVTTNKLPFQNTGSFNSFPKTSAPSKGTGPAWNILSMPPSSLSAFFVQMAPTVTENSSLIRNVHTSAASQGNTGQPTQNVPQNTMSPFMTLDNCNNQPLQNYSNSMRTSVYQQSSKCSSSSRRASTQNAYYYANGPGTSQVGTTVPLGTSPSHRFNSQQTFSCVVFPAEQNIQNQTSGPNPSMTMPVQSQQCMSNHLTPTQCAVSSDCHNRNATQAFSQTPNGNRSLSYPPSSVQINHGHFVQPQLLANVQNYHSPMLDQNSNVYSSQLGQNYQSMANIKETNQGSSIAYSVNGHRTDKQFSNESIKSSVGENLFNPVQIAGTDHPNEALAPMLSKTLEQGKNTSNAKGNFPESLSKDKVKITKESISLDLQKLHKLRNFFLKELYKVKVKWHLAAKENKQTSDYSVHSQNLNPSLPSSNSNENLLLPPLHEASQVSTVSSYDTTHSKPFSSVSCDSSQSKDDSLLIKKKDNYLLPILTGLLKGTTDENMILNAFFQKGDTHTNRQLTTEENSSSTLLVSSGDLSENNSIDKQNGLDLELSSASAINQLEKITAVAGEDMFHPFDENKDIRESSGQYLTSNLESSGQNADASDESSLSVKKVLKECTSDTYCSSVFQQGKKAEENIAGKNENTSATSSLPSLANTVLTVQEAGSVQKLSEIGNAYRMKGTCSLEELETSLALWRKNLPTSRCGYLSRSTESTGSSSSTENGASGKEIQQSLENLPSTLAQNDQTEVTNEITQHFALSSLGKIDAISTNLLKGCEPQVAIVTPLILSKDNIKNEMEKNSPSTEIMYPVIEEGGIQSSQSVSSAVPHTDRWKGVSSNSGKCYKDLDMSRKAGKFTEENGVVKTETKKNSSCDLNQWVDNCSPLQLKQHESQLITENCLQSDMCTGDLKQLPQDLLEPRDAGENTETDTMLHISSVCSLVQGDAYYNSQIASIFSNDPLKSSIQNDTSEEFVSSLQCNIQQSDLLKSELGINVSDPKGNTSLPSPNSLSVAIAEILESLPALDIPKSCKTSDENGEIKAEAMKNNILPESMPSSGKKLEQNVSHSSVHCTDMASAKLPDNEENLLSANISGGIIEKGSITKHAPVEENKAHSGSSIEAPISLLSDQLAELSKEFPYGIGHLMAVNVSESNDSLTKIIERDNTEISEESPNARDTEGQIKNILLNSRDMDVFPNQCSSNKSENHEDDQPQMDSEKNLGKKNLSCIKTEQCSDNDNENVPTGTAVTNKKGTFCCLRKFLALNYVVEPCSCPPEEDASEQKVGLFSQSDMMFQDKLKAEDNCKSFSFVTVSESVLSGSQNNETLQKASISREVKEYNPAEVDKAISPLVLLDKLDSQKPKRTKESVIAECSTQTTSLSLKREMVKIKEKHVISASECLSTEEVQGCSITKDLKMPPGRNLCKMGSDNQRSQRIVVKSKTDPCRRRRIEIKSGTGCERYRIKRDSNETHIIKGPALKKKKQKAMEKKLRSLAAQQSGTINVSLLSSTRSVSDRCENSEQNSMLPSQEDLNGKKLEKVKDLEKRYGYRKGERNEAAFSEHRKDKSEHSKSKSEHSKPESEHRKHSIKTISLQKYAYSEERKNAWKYRSLHSDNRTPLWQKQRGHAPNVSKKICSGREDVLDTHNRDMQSERSFADKKMSFRRTNSFQREQKKNYLNRLAFKRTAQKTIRLTTLDASYSKSSSFPGQHGENKSSSLPSRDPEENKQKMLEFKMCPEILFRNPVSEEQISDTKNFAEEDRTPVVAIKSKREDWLNYVPVKRRKTEDSEAPADHIPLDTAIKLINGDEALPIPMKDSNATFLTYQKIHLEKRNQSLDAGPLN
uniref:Retroelement silencing factor 1 n=1 Tax=Pogona vitticeps TaxID=103695 RepID=A0A6J0TH69_9SAUR